jgi:fucose permease
MYSLLLALIYLAFISLGLPDTILGSAWPAMYPALDVPVSYAGIISMIIAGCTIISSLKANRVISKFGTGLVTAVSVLMTAVALMGFSLSNAFWMLCVWALPYGLGAGAVDAGLNNFVALHYASKHMSWLHCFWGVGAALGPNIMSYSLTVKNSWERGYATIGILQIILTVVLLFSLPVWRRKEERERDRQTSRPKHVKIHERLSIIGVKQAMLAFFGYCALESTTGLWASSYLVLYWGIGVEAAARWASLFYLGITLGRFLNGFVTDRLGNRNMIRIGLLIITVGLLAVILPIPVDLVPLVGLILIGLGCAPIYPCIMHETPRNFGLENSQAIIGLQMASANAGTTFMPLIFGFLANHLSIALYPAYLSLFLVLMFLMTERLNYVISRKDRMKEME